jgi:putative hydrolase of the HAD superfamily
LKKDVGRCSRIGSVFDATSSRSVSVTGRVLSVGAVSRDVSFEAVLFDLDGTLCDHADSAEAVYHGTFEMAGIDRFGEPDDLWAALDDPPDHDDPVGYFARGFARVAAQHGRAPVDATALAEGFLETVDYSDVAPRPGAAAAVEAAASVARIGVVTNGPASRQAGKLEALPFGDAFDTVVYAGDRSRRKPNKDPFDRALEALGVDAENTLHVGDSLEYDVAGAQNAGLVAAWCPIGGTRDPDPYRPDHVFNLPSDIRDVLGNEQGESDGDKTPGQDGIGDVDRGTDHRPRDKDG